uniref:Uncharacterized protein n=1 Tax=uncultured marine thaumarchaeote KM3_04_H06 TaxID=1455967 RepID=A0A075G2A8_9ARCH|nr:hypothetical protein [uncultured marine thaumarchaeote KM3_04_H06]
MIEKDVVKKFIDSPFQLCGDGFDLTGGPEIRNHYRNWVALLHLLLVKHGKKKGFVFSNPPDAEKKDVIRICNKLKLLLKQTNVQVTEIIGKTRKMPEGFASALVKMQPSILVINKIPTWIASRNEATSVEIDSNVFDAKKNGKIEGFPDCCVDAFIERLWNDFELGWELLEEVKDENQVDKEIMRLIKLMGADYTVYENRVSVLTDVTAKQLIRHIHFIVLNTRHRIEEARIPSVIENNAKRTVDYARMFQKYPFVLHLACENCLSDPNSPSAKMNDRLSKFCKNEYPELYERIIDDVKGIDPQKQKSVLEEFWLKNYDYRFQL